VVVPIVQIALRELEPHLVTLRADLRAEFSSVLNERLELFHTEILQLMAESAPAEEESQKAESRDAKLTAAVHYYMLQLMGCSDKTAKGPRRGRTYYDLPVPFAEGAEVRKAQDNSRLWNPNWGLNVDIGVNAQFIQATVDIVLANGPASHAIVVEELPRTKVEGYAVQYFRNLRQQYQRRTTPEGIAKLLKKGNDDLTLQRKRRKADHMWRAVDAFKALYGAAACVGIENLCNSDWQSSDHSDVGQASQEVWNEFRDKAAAASLRILIRTRTQLNAIYSRLRSIASEAGVESVQSRSRFWGPPVNNNSDAPAQRKKKARKNCSQAPARPFKACISDSWAVRTGNIAVHESAPDTPVGWTIFDLEIPEGDLVPDGLGWVADVEDMEVD
ncbi:hypothetical protein C8Q76DRAFT_612206, partial [Earliella scabrosa]